MARGDAPRRRVGVSVIFTLAASISQWTVAPPSAARGTARAGGAQGISAITVRIRVRARVARERRETRQTPALLCGTTNQLMSGGSLD